MGKITEIKQKMKTKTEKAILEEVKRQLETALDLKEQGKDAEGDKIVNDMRKWLDGIIAKNEELTSSKEPLPIERSVLPQAGEIVAKGNKVILRVVREEEKEKYLAVTYEYSCMKGAYKDEIFRETAWQEFLTDSTFVCSIYDKESDEYVGYCSIKELMKEEWELAIELEKNACHKGYGAEALQLLIQSIYSLTGRRFFRARVEIDNHASQGLMRKLGATPNGVSEFLLRGEGIKQFNEENKDLITDEIRAVAAEFCMNAEDILGYVLEYRFDMEATDGCKNANAS